MGINTYMFSDIFTDTGIVELAGRTALLYKD